MYDKNKARVLEREREMRMRRLFVFQVVKKTRKEKSAIYYNLSGRGDDIGRIYSNVTKDLYCSQRVLW